MVSTYRYPVRETPQSQPIPGTNQVPNNAGGFAFQIDDWKRLERFLILGTEGGTFYVKEQAITLANAECVRRCIAADGTRTVATIVEISSSGRAAKNDPAIFALAMCLSFGDNETKALARGALPQVCRIGTHLFHFAQFVEQMRGWGRALKSAVAQWYDNQTENALAYDIVKYQQRDGWSHKDLIILSHPHQHPTIYDAVVHDNLHVDAPFIMHEVKALQSFGEGEAKEAAKYLLDAATNIPRECVPTRLLNSPAVWEALLLRGMPMEAMVRNLGNMSKVGLLTSFSDAAKIVAGKLADEELILRARMHPLKLLVALKTYAQGQGIRGRGAWAVVPQVVDALNNAFYTAFGAVTPTNKNTMLALDVSGSMEWGGLLNMPITPREGTAAMALVTANVEPNYMITAFSTRMVPINISAGQRLDNVLRTIGAIPMGGTDCALPMVYALENRLDVDTFVVYTDNETWAGRIHPVQALRQYNEQRGRNAKLVVVGMTATEFSIAEQGNPNMLDVVGFDTNTPEAISEFVRM